jgi:TolB-like protein/class 3 adenylate cyclase/Tfp pilus assembly protein PilF
MADEQKAKRLEIAHVLFMDIVGYSKLLTDEQSEALQELNQIVRGTEAAHAAEAAGQLTILPTGDGMALVFAGSVEEPVECALEISHALRAQPSLPVRMGIHSGPVHHVKDANGRENIAGIGINIAQRVMDCGDAGHILVSKRVADDLAQQRRWQPYLHELGDVEVKHGVVVSLVNLYAETIGNPMPPTRLGDVRGSVHAMSKGPRKGLSPIVRAIFIILGLFIGLVFVLAIVSVIFAPAIMRTLDQHRSATHVQPTATASPSLADTIKSAVAKQITDELQSELSGKKKAAVEPTPSGSSIPEKSIAVLPFENLSDDKQNAFFAEGVQDEVLTDLAKIADLKVISRTSVMQYKASEARNLREIGRALGVAHVLEGSVQRIANKVRVNAQLIDARNDAHVWAQSYTRDLADVFGIQSEIAEAIAQQLEAHLSADEKARMARSSTTDAVAYDLYLRARQLDDLANDPDAKTHLLQAIDLLEEAVRRDPKFLRAYCLMCETHLDLYWGGIDHTDQRRELARIALQKAEELQPDAGEVHAQKGLYAYHGFRDYDGALKELEKAKELLPNEARIYTTIGAVDRRTARWKEAQANFRRAVQLDPRNFLVLVEAGSAFQGMRLYPEARALLERALKIMPDDPFARFLLGFSFFAETGDIAGLKKQLDMIVQQGPHAERTVAYPLLYCSWVQRDRVAAEKAVALIPPEGIANSFDEAGVPREYCVGRTAWLFGDKDLAKRALGSARTIFERTTKEQPDYPQAWAYLGLTDAMLGRCSEAIQEGKRACEIMPYTKDSWVGPAFTIYLAEIYAVCGEKDAALEQLKISAELPVGITYGELKQSPEWESLRGDPRFEKIMASLAPKESVGAK